MERVEKRERVIGSLLFERRRIRTLRSSVRKMRHIGSTTNAHERLSAIPAPLATHTAHGASAHSSPSAANQHAYVPK